MERTVRTFPMCVHLRSAQAQESRVPLSSARTHLVAGLVASLVAILVVTACRAPERDALATPTPAASATASAATPTPEPSRPSATASASPTATPSSTPAGTATAVPTAPASFTVQVRPTSIGRGETLFVRVASAAAGTVRTAAGYSVPLLPSADGSAWAVVGVGLYADYGRATLSVTARDAQGKPLAGVATASYTVVDPQRPADYLQVTDEVGAILTPDAGATENALRAQQFSSFDAMPRWQRAFQYPLAAFEVSTPFGSGRSINGGPIGDFHSGEDLAADEGARVGAAAPGRVAWIGPMPIRGNSVIVDHGAGVMTGYHHLHDISVVVGQDVEAGALLGHVGSTGFATGPHLHWELMIFSVNVDPATWTTDAFLSR